MRSAMVAARPDSTDAGERKNLSLLIVEEDHDLLERLTQRFIRAGYHVVSAWHPRQALAAASVRTFQVALLDASLPEMDGFDLMQRLKRLQEALQVVILSGYEYPERRVTKEGAFACLSAQDRLDLLQATVEEAFERAASDSPQKGKRIRENTHVGAPQ